MKKFVFLMILLFSFNLTILNANAESKTFTQGIYDARNSNLLIATPINVKIASANEKAIIMIIDSNQNIQELVRLNAETPEHSLKPLSYGSSVIVFGSNVIFS